jgi:hypothetical protein
MSVPLHWDSNRMPVGSQFAARKGAEATLLALAYELEDAPFQSREGGGKCQQQIGANGQDFEVDAT